VTGDAKTAGQQKRPVRWPGGVLLVAVGLSSAQVQTAIDRLAPHAASLTVLADGANAEAAQAADEVWVYQRLGLRGFLALIRRISWRHFESVYQPSPAALPLLRYLVWPRPPWFVNLTERRQA